jgi:hypothetical protein
MEEVKPQRGNRNNKTGSIEGCTEDQQLLNNELGKPYEDYGISDYALDVI